MSAEKRRCGANAAKIDFLVGRWKKEAGSFRKFESWKIEDDAGSLNLLNCFIDLSLLIINVSI